MQTPLSMETGRKSARKDDRHQPGLLARKFLAPNTKPPEQDGGCATPPDLSGETPGRGARSGCTALVARSGIFGNAERVLKLISGQGQGEPGAIYVWWTDHIPNRGE